MHSLRVTLAQIQKEFNIDINLMIFLIKECAGNIKSKKQLSTEVILKPDSSFASNELFSNQFILYLRNFLIAKRINFTDYVEMYTFLEETTNKNEFIGEFTNNFLKKDNPTLVSSLEKFLAKLTVVDNKRVNIQLLFLNIERCVFRLKINEDEFALLHEKSDSKLLVSSSSTDQNNKLKDFLSHYYNIIIKYERNTEIRNFSEKLIKEVLLK